MQNCNWASGGFGFYSQAALTYEAGRIAAFDIYATYQTSTARTGDVFTSAADERFSRSVVGGQFRIWW